jgi:hypothetical protein
LAERIVWNDLGQVHLVVPDCSGDIVLTLESITLHAFIVAKPLEASSFEWLIQDIDAIQQYWTKQSEKLTEGTLYEDSFKMYMRFRKQFPSFTLGLDTGLYLCVETRATRMSLDFFLAKGEQELMQRALESDQVRISVIRNPVP